MWSEKLTLAFNFVSLELYARKLFKKSRLGLLKGISGRGAKTTARNHYVKVDNMRERRCVFIEQVFSLLSRHLKPGLICQFEVVPLRGPSL